MALDYDFTVQNTGSTTRSITMFDVGNPDSQVGSTYTFSLPYQATYSVDQFFLLWVGGAEKFIYLQVPTSRENIVPMLNSIGFGDWAIDSSIANNIYKCFSPTVITLLEVDTLSDPVSIAPSSITANGFTANWSAATGATGYYLDIATDSNFESLLPSYDSFDVGNILTYNVTNLSSGVYYYRVRSYHNSVVSSVSATLNVITLIIPPVISAPSGVASSSFIANWALVTNATGYYLDVSTDYGFSSFVAGFNNLNVGNVLTYSVTGLSANVTYYYRLRAYNASYTSNNTSAISVTTIGLMLKKTPTAGKEVTSIQLFGASGTANIDWGDGSAIETFTLSLNQTKTHTYTTSSIEKTISITNPTSITQIQCSFSSITYIDVSACTLLFNFYCSNNYLTSLNVSSCPALNYLDCSTNQITALDTSNCTVLTQLRCYINSLTSLNVNNCAILTHLYCYSNQLTALNVSSNIALIELKCHANSLTTIDVSNKTLLNTFYCYTNSLTSINIAGCTSLQFLECNNNSLTTINTNDNTALVRFYCNFNVITSLNIATNINLGAMEFGSNKLPTSYVNSILASCVAFGTNSKTLGIASQTPSAPPSGQGILDKATLISRSWSVGTD